MGILSSVVIILFVIDAILLILLVLLQTDQGDSLGGLFSGSSQTAFGSRSSNILIKITSVLAALFFAGTFVVALLNKPQGAIASQASTEPWYKTAAPATGTAEPATTTPATGTPATDAPATGGTAPTTGTTAPATSSTTPLESPAAPAATP